MCILWFSAYAEAIATVGLTIGISIHRNLADHLHSLQYYPTNYPVLCEPGEDYSNYGYFPKYNKPVKALEEWKKNENMLVFIDKKTESNEADQANNMPDSSLMAWSSASGWDLTRKPIASSCT